MEKQKIDELTIVKIIASAGDAIGMMHQAYFEAQNGNEEKADELLTKSEEALVQAHQIQTTLIQNEAAGNEIEINLLMVHAQDHLMNAILTKQLIYDLISMQKQINVLKGEK